MGAVADLGLVIGAGPWEGFGNGAPSPTAPAGLGAEATTIFSLDMLLENRFGVKTTQTLYRSETIFAGQWRKNVVKNILDTIKNVSNAIQSY